MDNRSQLRRIGSNVGARFARLSLRARLLLGLVLVAAVGLIAADVVVYGQIDSYLNAQVDTELQSGASSVVAALNHRSGNLTARLPLNTAAVVESLSGDVIESVPSNFQLAVSHAMFSSIVKSALAGGSSLITTSGKSAGSSVPYRVLPEAVTINSPFSPSAQGVALIAIPLDSLDGTLHQLIVAELAVSAAVVALLGLLGYVVVRVGLRPLVEIEETAGAIAGGDLARRVERDDPKTEIGRLGASLNTMLGQIEHAFTEQQASENRLRQFLADASRELRTPVTSIRGYAELFRRGAAERPADLAQAMRRIEDESTRMGGLVDDLLLLARLDQGRPLELRPVDLAGIATDVAADVAALHPERPITVDTKAAVVDGDEQRLRQVVTNLVQNTLRHTPAETPIAVVVDVAGDRATLSIHDDGPGIPPEHVGRIFERFYRGDPSRTRNSGGSGLGLAIVSSIAEAHGGRARVESVEGEGSTFIVDLPLMRFEDYLSRRPEGLLSSTDNGRAIGNPLRQDAASSGDEGVDAAHQLPSES